MLRGLTASTPVLLVLVLAPALHADAVRVSVQDRSAGKHCLENAVISAVPEGGDAISAPVAGVTSIELDAARSWQLRAKRDGCWSTTTTWIAPGTNEIAIELFSAASLQGEFTTETGKRPDVLRAFAFRTTTRPSNLPEPEALDCLLQLPKWQCTVPAELQLDVRLHVEAFAPVYLWSITARPGERRNIGSQKLIAGASLAGWIENPDSDPVAGAVVTLAPLQAEHDSAARAIATQHRVVSNARGFFQFTGVPPGDYRLVSRASAFAPVVVPAMTVRPFAAMTWPRPLRHAHALTLNVALDPPKATDGSDWQVAVVERIPLTPGTSPVPKPLAADTSGLWTTAGLRPDMYELVVKDRSGSVVERRNIDLTTGAPAVLTVSIRAITVTGVVKVGDEPLAAADIRFSNLDAKTVSVTSNEDGRFTTSFPASGRWTPLIYPYGRQSRMQVRAKPVEIPDQGDDSLEIVLPGGRIRGTVVTQDGTTVKAAVHVVKDGTLAAQQTTSVDGKFDFIGLAEGAYAVSAEADAGATPHAVETRLAANDTKDLKLALEPYRTVRGVVRTPGGQPGSGAIMRISTDGGVSWSDLVVGVQGEFEYAFPGGLNEVVLVVLTNAYPAAMMRIGLGAGAQAPVVINLLPYGGELFVEPARAYVIRQNVAVPLFAFHLPNSLGVAPRVHLEAGSYMVCRDVRVDDDCRRVLIAPGTTTTVDFRARKEQVNAR
jgi:hypothetical protein